VKIIKQSPCVEFADGWLLIREDGTHSGCLYDSRRQARAKSRTLPGWRPVRCRTILAWEGKQNGVTVRLNGFKKARKL
jgi:hypothetical protein